MSFWNVNENKRKLCHGKQGGCYWLLSEKRLTTYTKMMSRHFKECIAWLKRMLLFCKNNFAFPLKKRIHKSHKSHWYLFSPVNLLTQSPFPSICCISAGTIIKWRALHSLHPKTMNFDVDAAALHIFLSNTLLRPLSPMLHHRLLLHPVTEKCCGAADCKNLTSCLFSLCSHETSSRQKDDQIASGSWTSHTFGTLHETLCIIRKSLSNTDTLLHYLDGSQCH